MTAATPQAKPRLEWVDAGKGLAITLVAMYHSASWLLGAGFEIDGWRQVNEALSSLRMPLFFMLAGLFAAKWLTASWRALWRSKLSLFVWVFLVWEVIGSAVFLLGLTMKGQPINLVGTIRDLVVSPIAPRFELWFIWALAIFFVVAKLIRRIDWRIQLVVAGVCSATALSGWETANIGWSGSIKYCFFFLAGLYLKDAVFRLSRARVGVLLVTLMVSWVAVSAVVAVFGLRWVPGLYFVNCVLGVVTGVTVSRWLARIPRLVSIGSNTLPVYLTHTPLIIVMAYLLALLARVTPIAVVAPGLPPVLAGLAIAGSLLISGAAMRGPARVLYEAPGFLRGPTPAPTRGRHADVR
ncbi:acyltransferase family protein [Plantibacter sp. ME-Dv--P-095]|uniref:acyltransferase family protein n=1 Tax=Plantibacter sp. ME-Dv--P-095 TaxID=3040299 RepID=UPI0025512245|nr:acyltransferase family protein [Plantibacter sp. ME-Dv--P-095]